MWPVLNAAVAASLTCGTTQVMGFWRKAERVVYYKHQAVLDARKREAYDKQLDFLVDQTQRYSSLLAQRLTHGDGGRSQTPPHALLPSARQGWSNAASFLKVQAL